VNQPTPLRPYAKVHARWGRSVEPPHFEWTWRILEALYTEPHRAYHNLSHVAACLDLLDEFEKDTRPTINRTPVELALMFHDAVYVPGDKRNEELSANLLRALASVLPWTETTVERAVVAILATRSHETFVDDPVAQLVVDIDLSILGAEPLAYSDYVHCIRREYKSVSDDAWRVGRTAFLDKMRARAHIFNTGWAEDRFESKARANMQHELDSLKDHP
jgi:predicted metal-dependent HD superfamily phosphohydrolase